MTWTTPVHQSPDPPGDSETFNDQVIENLKHLHTGKPLWVPPLSDCLDGVMSGIVNGAVLVPTMVKDVITVTKLAWRANSAGGQIDVGIFSDNGDGLTVSKVTSSGLHAMPSGSGAHYSSFAVAATLDPFVKYWLVMGFTSVNAALSGTTGPAQQLCKKATNCMPLPNVITFGSPRPLVSPCLAALP
jgi:hypothetical protein